MKIRNLLLFSILILLFNISSSFAIDDFINKYGDPIDTLIREGLKYFYTYHLDPKNLDRSNEKFLEVLKNDKNNEDGLWLVSRNYFKFGDNSVDKKDKLENYSKGIEYADECLKHHPDSIECHFWRMGNIGRYSDTKGILNSLVNLPTIRSEINYLIENAPKDHEFYILSLDAKANLLIALPGIMGRDLKESENLLKKTIELSPNLPLLDRDLAKNYIEQKRYAEARALLNKVIDFQKEKEPKYIWDYVLYDVPIAKKMLADIKEK